MAHVDAHPYPTQKCEKPEPLHPGATEMERAEHRKKLDRYNARVLALRRHVVAKALDELAVKGNDIGPVESIVYVLGVAWLEGSTARAVGSERLDALLSLLT